MEGSLMGDPRQIDGLGGANSLTSKVAIVSLSAKSDCDLDYEFLQVVVGKGRVSTTQTCGNILAGVLPFAIESGMIQATEPTTSAKINIVNTGGVCEVIVQTPNKKVNYAGDTKIDGVVGTAAPIICNYLDTVGSTCGALLPTGNKTDIIDGIETTCIDNGMPVVVMQAADFGLMGNESKEILEANEDLKTQIEKIRLQAGYLMNLGDVSEQTIPKMCLISAPENGGVVNTRMFIPHVVHEAIGVLAAVSVATAFILPNSVCQNMRNDECIMNSTEHNPLNITHYALSIEHPSGEFTVSLEYEVMRNDELVMNNTEHNPSNIMHSSLRIIKSGVIRTARLLSSGEVFVP
jgi:4-oxalomesaconate tautomerase